MWNIYITVILIFVILISSFIFPNKNKQNIFKKIGENKMKHYKNVSCKFKNSLFFEEKVFDIYINKNYILLLNSSYNKFYYPLELFNENYIIPLNPKSTHSKEFPIDLFLNYIEIETIGDNIKKIQIQGKLFSKTLFNKNFNFKENLNIDIILPF